MTQTELLDYTTAGGGHASLKGVGQAMRREEQNIQETNRPVIQRQELLSLPGKSVKDVPTD